MMINSNMLRYKENQITSASPAQTVLMLYDGAIRFIRSAITEFEENDNIAEKSILIEKAVKIIDYLQSCLDQEKGGVIAENLDKLYDYMLITITQANLNNDMEKIKEVLNLLLTLREGWNEINNNDNVNNTNANQYEDNTNKADNTVQETGPDLNQARKVGIKA